MLKYLICATEWNVIILDARGDRRFEVEKEIFFYIRKLRIVPETSRFPFCHLSIHPQPHHKRSSAGPIFHSRALRPFRNKRPRFSRRRVFRRSDRRSRVSSARRTFSRGRPSGRSFVAYVFCLRACNTYARPRGSLIFLSTRARSLSPVKCAPYSSVNLCACTVFFCPEIRYLNDARRNYVMNFTAEIIGYDKTRTALDKSARTLKIHRSAVTSFYLYTRVT